MLNDVSYNELTLLYKLLPRSSNLLLTFLFDENLDPETQKIQHTSYQPMAGLY